MHSPKHPRSPALRLALVAGLLLLAPWTAQAEDLQAQAVPLDAFALDGFERVIAPKGPVRCPKVERVMYRGDLVRYHSPVLVNPHFRERLVRFEAVVREVAIAFYGRAPRRIRHMGTYNCRRIAAWPEFLSEHGLANAIDVAGFDFGPAPRKLRADTPRALRGAFKVRLLRHWDQHEGVQAVHSRFLKALADRLIARPDIFRVLLGPAYPGHKNHFHFDCAPWRLVDV